VNYPNYILIDDNLSNSIITYTLIYIKIYLIYYNCIYIHPLTFKKLKSIQNYIKTCDIQLNVTLNQQDHFYVTHENF